MSTNIVKIALSASLVFAPAAAFVFTFAGLGPASAHERDCWPPGHCKHGKKWKGKERDVVVVERPVYVAPPPRVVYAPPPMVVAPAPVVVAPPRPAGVHLGVDIPLR
jgi:hypothetical protein